MMAGPPPRKRPRGLGPGQVRYIREWHGPLNPIEHMKLMGLSADKIFENNPWMRDSPQLHSVVATDDAYLRAVEGLLDEGSNLRCLDSLGFTPLDQRCVEAEYWSGRATKVLRYLLAQGANYDTRAMFSNTAIFTAIRTQQPLDAVQQLVQAGADVRARDFSGYTTIHYAGRHKRLDLVHYLMEQGVEPDSRSFTGENVLPFVFVQASPEYLRHLVLVRGVSPKTKAPGNRSLLRYAYESAVRSGLVQRPEFAEFVEKVRFCLLHGAEVEKFWHGVMGRAGVGLFRDELEIYVALQEFTDRSVDNSRSRMLSRNYQILNEVCKLELAELKDFKFHGNVTLWNILTDSDRKMMGHVRSEELMMAFRRTCREQMEKIYLPHLIERVNNFFDLNEIKQTAVKVLGETLATVTDYLAVEEIAKYLGTKDLYNLARFDKE